MADNPVFVDNEGILYINKDDSYEENSQYDMPDTSKIEETLFTEQPTVRLKQTQNPRLLCQRIIYLYRYLDVDSTNVDLVNSKLFKYKESERKRGQVELYYDNGKTWVRLTNTETGKFLAKSTLKKIWEALIIRKTFW